MKLAQAGLEAGPEPALEPPLRMVRSGLERITGYMVWSTSTHRPYRSVLFDFSNISAASWHLFELPSFYE
jgi:hypothetical protein